MNEDVIHDLKQFIEATVSQNTESLRTDIKKDIIRVDEKIDLIEERLGKKIDDLSSSVAEAIDTTNEATQQQIDQQKARIKTLEKQAA